MLNGYKDLIQAALSDFKRNKVRTFLTSLGITIGVLAVVMLIALGLGIKNYIREQFESLGANLITVLPGSGFGGPGGGFGASLIGGTKFDEKDLKELERIPELKYVVPVFFKTSRVEANGKKEFAYIRGVNEEFFKLRNVKTIRGRQFTQSENQSKAKVAVIGYTIAEKLFGNPDNAVGKTIRFEKQRFEVIGVIEKSGNNEQDSGVVVPYRSTYGSINPDKTFWGINIGVESETDIETAKKKIKEALLKRYKEDDFSVAEQAEILSTINQIFNILNAVLVAIGSISLLVGGIGIMNIMYASVTERTKEIGIRRAIGATEKDILVQFLVEAVLLSALGGVLGLILASIIVILVRPFFPLSINLLSVVVTLTVSSAIGIFFGVFPARRAAQLPPIEAIRYE
ncbi:MAG: ABC transporter permease [Patescibacteria group bacterium]|nr:MAG: ABC transporter permease [Patescibacteria group bacterium]